MKLFFNLMLFCIINYYDCITLQDSLKNGMVIFQRDLTKLVDKNLGHPILQERIYNVSQEVAVNHKSILDRFVNDLSAKTKMAEETLADLQSFILSDYETNTNGENRRIQSCCTYDKQKTSFDSIFGEEVNLNDICEQSLTDTSFCPSFGESNQGTPVHILNKDETLKKLENVYKEKVKGYGRYIYYGASDGYGVTYPAYREPNQCNCLEKDPRYRPWYVETAKKNEEKDIIVVLDFTNKVKAMEETLKTVAKLLVKLIDNKSRIAFFFYRDYKMISANSVFACLSTLTQASPLIKEKIIQKINEFDVAGDDMKYEDIFKAGFGKFDSNSNRGKQFIFVTSGNNNEISTNAKNFFLTERSKFGCNVSTALVLLPTVGLDNTRYLLNRDLPNLECNQDQNNLFIEISKDDGAPELYEKISRIYKFTNFDHLKTEVVYVKPFTDRLNRGTTIDACKQVVNKNNELLGVVCISFLSEELIRSQTEFSTSEQSYWFLTDSKGITYIHPKFGQPLNEEETSNQVDIKTLETSEEFQNMYVDIQRGVRSGEKSFEAPTSVSRGPFGAKLDVKKMKYSWRQVPFSNLVLCIITSQDHREFKLDTSELGISKEYYHRMDLWDEFIKFCKFHGTQVADTGTAVIMIPHEFFMRSNNYYKEETTENIKTLMNLFAYKSKQQTPPNGLFKSLDSFHLVRDWVKVTSLMNDIWFNDFSPKTSDFLLRFIGTDIGFFRSYPAHIINPFYDPRARTWYRLAIAQGDNMVLTTPYEDAVTRTNVMSLTKTFFKGRGTSEVGGVIAMDFTVHYLQLLLKQSFIECKNEPNKCIIIDKNGFVNFHQGFVVTPDSKLENIHIVKLLPRLAKRLIERRVMIKNNCIEFRNKQTVVEWFYSFDHLVSIVQEDFGCLSYTIIPALKTNIFLLYLNDQCTDEVNDCHCQEPENGEKLGTCSQNINTMNCECPCIEPKLCTPASVFTNIKLRCQPEDKPKMIFSTNWYKKDTSNLPLCNDPECQLYKGSSGCNRIGCQWCSQYPNKTSARDEDKYCARDSNKCFVSNAPKEDDGDDSLSTGTVAAIIIGIVVFAVIIVIIVMIFVKRKRPPKEKQLPSETGIKSAAFEPAFEPTFEPAVLHV